jgi:serine/threonine protein kinase
MPDDKSTLVGSVFSDYKIIKYIASGSFGDVYSAIDTKTNEKVALKIPIENKEKHGEKWLIDEAKVYNKLNKNKDENVYISKMKIIKIKELNKKIIVMDLLGDSLDVKLYKSKNKKLGIKTVIMLAIQMIQSLKYIHDCGYIHRDIKPDNFVMDNIDENKLYCIDFGMAKKYINSNGSQLKFTKDHKFCGTGRYASIAAHRGYAQSRKDDLESIGYLLVYLFKSKLPWQNIKHKDKNERYSLVMKKKIEITEEELCDQMPKEFLIYLKYVKTMDYDEAPLYNSLIKMFKKLLNSRKFKNLNYEWKCD